MNNSNQNQLLGSKENPYTFDDYQDLFTNPSLSWNGGWVKSNNIYTYYNTEGSGYTDYGTKASPYPNDVYSEMAGNNFWTGGWVDMDSDGIVYITANCICFDENDGDLGSINNPCIVELFEDMVYNHLWRGGWVNYGAGIQHYISNYDLILPGEGCGCGCGSSGGSGSGSGSGSDGGQGNNTPSDGSGSGSGNGDGEVHSVGSGSGIAATIDNGKCNLVITWSSGYTTREPYASISTDITISNWGLDNYEINDKQIYANWDGAYGIHLSGTFSLKYYPEGKASSIFYVLYYQIGLGDYTIPMQYHL